MNKLNFDFDTMMYQMCFVFSIALVAARVVEYLVAKYGTSDEYYF